MKESEALSICRDFGTLGPVRVGTRSDNAHQREGLDWEGQQAEG